MLVSLLSSICQSTTPAAITLTMTISGLSAFSACFHERPPCWCFLVNSYVDEICWPLQTVALVYPCCHVLSITIPYNILNYGTQTSTIVYVSQE